MVETDAQFHVKIMAPSIDSLLLSFVGIILMCIVVNKNIDALANCPPSCKCDEDTLIVNCGEGDLDVLPIALNPSIKRLIIQNNKIRTIDSSIQFYAEVEFLDLSSNHLLTIPANTFHYQKKLQELHLNRNKIGTFTNQTFIGLATLASLNLRENLLTALSAFAFSTLTKLEELNLGKNQIASIDANAFNGLTNLRVLYLDDNTLTMVPSQAFGEVPALAELHLGLNSFATIEADAFEQLRGLSLLDLNGAGVVNVSLEAFRGLENSLRNLDLSDNRLKLIPTEALSILARVEKLALGQNDFETIAEGALTGLVNLRSLDVTGSHTLRLIEANAFSTNTNLDTLTLVANIELKEIEIGAFSGLPHLKHCDFRENALSTLPENLFKWKALETVDFSGNPLICDCRILWLRNLILNTRNSSKRIQENVLCASPDAFKNKPLATISPNAIGCSFTDTRKQTIIGITLVGLAAVITALILFICRCRHLRDALKCRWSSNALDRKEREFQKTFCDEDDTHANRHHSYGLSAQRQQYHHPGIRPIPVTEL